jgi:hypothetical protein
MLHVATTRMQAHTPDMHSSKHTYAPPCRLPSPKWQSRIVRRRSICVPSRTAVQDLTRLPLRATACLVVHRLEACNTQPKPQLTGWLQHRPLLQLLDPCTLSQRVGGDEQRTKGMPSRPQQLQGLKHCRSHPCTATSPPSPSPSVPCQGPKSLCGGQTGVTTTQPGMLAPRRSCWHV